METDSFTSAFRICNNLAHPRQGDHAVVASYLAVRILIAFLAVGCSRKAAQTDPPPPEVLVTTVKPQDVPRVLERVATLDGFINANINAQVQGYIFRATIRRRSLPGQKASDVIAIRSVCYLPMTYDHRLVDGADTRRFLSAVRARLEGT